MRLGWICLIAAAFGLILTAPSRAEDDQAAGLRHKQAGDFAAAEVAFQRAVKRNPQDGESLRQLATVEGWLGQFDKSLATWKRAYALSPRDPEVQMGIGRLFFWKGEHAKALAWLDRAFGERSENVEAVVLRGDVLAALGKHAAARSAYGRARAMKPDYPDLEKKLKGAVAPPLWRIDTGYIAESFSRSRRHEYGAYAQIGRAFPGRGATWLRYDYQKQFSRHDRSYQLGGAYLPQRRVLLTAEYAFTPDNKIRSRSVINGGVEFILPYVTPLMRYRRLDYVEGDIHTYTPGARVTFADWLNNEVLYSVSRNLNGTTTYAYQLRANFAIGEAVAPYLAFAHGKESIPPQAEAISSYYSAGVVWNIGRFWGVRLDYTHEYRVEFYTHRSFGSGVTWKF